MKILFCSSEVSPFSKTGGLADVAGALPKALSKLGHDIRVITPLYNSVKLHYKKLKLVATRDLIIIDKIKTASYFEYKEDGVIYYFVQCDDYFKRDNLYDYYDEAERFSFFNYAILEGLPAFDFYPDIIHVNDWQTALVPYFLDELYRKKGKEYFKIKTLLTIHNLEYQGSFPMDANLLMPYQDDYTYVHFDRINFLKTGIMRASAINTVSKTYKDEIMTQKYGFGLDGSIRSRANQTYGIVNGIDYDIYNPAFDPIIIANYDANSFLEGKRKNKKALLDELDFPSSSLDKPLISFIGRLAHQKGIDLMINVLTDVIRNSDANFILIGSGNPQYENFFNELHLNYKERVKVWIGFNNELARKTYAASDLFLMPSEFEPCGLGQLIAMRYGTLPIVRETGGLLDTVLPYNEYTVSGTGFSFTHYEAYDFKDAIFRGIDLYHHNKNDFDELVYNSMIQDFSTDNMALDYQELYSIIKRGY
ncbi:glycogen synthase [Acholeplasma sp. OttesenSCG-928-E16]|nr:glycogen synthase [Acholeplasma sp. OttesenSCG-928-E16]